MNPTAKTDRVSFASWIKSVIMLGKFRDLYLLAGRGTGKTTDILASRAEDVIREMPRGTFVITSDTYANLMTNIIPNIIKGWEERCNFYMGEHFLVDKEPPAHWDRPLYIKTLSYRHTISTFNGCKFYMTSLDRPSANAGLSVVHIFGDEAKYLREAKLNKLFPTLRGDVEMFGHSPYFLGKTFVSDMPNPFMPGEDDWMLRMEKNMDRRQIEQTVQAGIVVNDIMYKLYESYKKGASQRQINNLSNQLANWIVRHKGARHNTIFFYVVSSYANAQILTREYFENLKKTLADEEYRRAVLSMRVLVDEGMKFYPNLTERHFYRDGYNYNFYDRYGLMDSVPVSSLGLRYINHSAPLEAGFDGGNMMSLLLGQPQGNTYRVLKDMFVLAKPNVWIRQLADQFLEFFKNHKKKILKLYPDRATRAYSRSNQDMAGELKSCIEKTIEGKPTGWRVKIEDEGAGNISQRAEYDFMNTIMGEQDPALPKLQIDYYNCPRLRSSLQIARIKKSSKGELQKDKSSERLSLERLPYESTNMSDAFKYLIMRRKWIPRTRQSHSNSPSDAKVVN